jgi:hypothetical protein
LWHAAESQRAAYRSHSAFAASASGPAGESSQALLPVNPARLGRKYSLRPEPRKRRKQKPSSASATGRSGFPSPAATESPSPAIRKSCTRISADALSTLPSARVMPTAAMVVRPYRTRSRISCPHGAVTCFGGGVPSSKLQVQVASAGTGPARRTPIR